MNVYLLRKRDPLGDAMGSTTVIAVRIPKRLKEELEELGIDYAEEIRRFLEQRVREEKAKRLLKEVEEIVRSVPRIRGNLAAEFVREDRDRG